MRSSVLAALLWGAVPAAAVAAAPEPGPTTLVVCAPGYPGSTGEASGVMAGFADALAAAAGEPPGALAAEYHETETGGAERLARPDAGLLLAPLPFYLEHEARLRLTARAQAVEQGGEPSEEFSLVAGRGRVAGPKGLDGWEILGTVGYAPRFVRGPLLGSWGELPATARIVFSGAVLSALRRAAAGEKVAVLLDRAQAKELASLPYGRELEVLTRSLPVPAFVVATVGDRVAPSRARSLTQALLGFAARPAGAATLADLRLDRFVPLDEAGLARARRAHAGAAPRP
jgi:hypothetical protein